MQRCVAVPAPPHPLLLAESQSTVWGARPEREVKRVVGSGAGLPELDPGSTLTGFVTLVCYLTTLPPFPPL